MKNNLKELRKERKMLQSDVAELVGISKAAYGYYEQGKTVPKLQHALKLSQIFGKTVEEIFFN